MANINKINGISGFQGTDVSCENVSLYGLRNYIDKVFATSTSGSSYSVQPASSSNSPFATIKNFECGNGYIFFRSGAESSWSVFNIPHFEQGNLENNSNKLVTTLFPEHFTIEGKGEFHLTSGVNDPGSGSKAWYQTMPVYKTLDSSLKCWFNGSSYVISSRVGNTSSSVLNNSFIPNAPYGDAKTSSATVEISGFTGGSANANGLYAEVGYVNGKILYRHAKTGDFYYFFSGQTWVLTDTPITVNGGACYVNGGSDVNGKLDNSGGSNGNCCDGQTANVSDGSMDPRSLATEDEDSLMSTEDKLKVLITEDDM